MVGVCFGMILPQRPQRKRREIISRRKKEETMPNAQCPIKIFARLTK